MKTAQQLQLHDYLMNSESSTRFYQAIIGIEDHLHWLRCIPLCLLIRWQQRHNMRYSEPPPIVHAGYVWGEYVLGR